MRRPITMLMRMKYSAIPILICGGILAAILLPSRLQAAAGTLMPTPYQSVFDSNGNPVSGGCIWTYQAGTSTPVATYTDKALTVPNANPIIADTAGQFVAWLTVGQSYKFVYESACTPPAHGSILRTVDNVDAVPSSSSAIDVPATAGETLTLGQCAYLSDGSGGKTAGQWFKCDSANYYSSLTPEVGIAPAGITSGQTGSIRISGQVTGMSSLSVGLEYFVGSGGAITSTAPAFRRHLGHADSATTFVVTGDPPPPQTISSIQEFRLTLTTATCVTSTDVTGATTLFFTPCLGSRIALSDASGNMEICSSAEKSIAVPATTAQMYDVWIYDSTFGSCTVTLELLAWTNDTTRATAIARTTTGWYTKSGDLTRRYVGSFRTAGVSGQTEDSVLKRYLWNYYNRVDRQLKRFETTTSWTYGSATIRQANGSTSNQVETVLGVAEDPVDITIEASYTNTTSSFAPVVGFGLDSTTTFAGDQSLATVYGVAAVGGRAGAHYVGFPGIGRHVLSWNEVSTGSAGGATFVSNTGNIGGITTGGNLQSGISGRMKG